MLGLRHRSQRLSSSKRGHIGFRGFRVQGLKSLKGGIWGVCRGPLPGLLRGILGVSTIAHMGFLRFQGAGEVC